MFRILSIRSTMVGLVAVAVAAASLLAAVGVAGGAEQRARADRDRRRAAVAGLAASAVHELQEERVRAAAWVAGRRGQRELAARRQRVDRVLAAYRAGATGLRGSGAGGTGDPALDRVAAAGRLDRLAVVRAEADRRLVTPERTVADHDAVVAALLEVGRGLAARLEAPGSAGTARLLHALGAAKEASGQERTLLASVASGDRPGPRGPALPAGALGARLAAAAAVARHELDGVRAAAGDRLAGVERALATPGAAGVRRLELALLDPAVAPSPPGRRAADEPSAADLERWRDGLAARAGALRRLERQAAGSLTGAATAWQQRQERRLLVQLALLVVAVALPALGWLLARATARRAQGPEAPAPATLVGMARRGRALVDRQLQLLDELEREEPDPERRSGLHRLQHLAGRLRRNAETLLGMTDPEPARRPDRPAPVAALLRAAVAEIEASRRVELSATDDVEVAGPAAVDLVHLVAELLDNAAAFSPPTAGVTVTGAVDGDGYLVEVTDRGLGMTDEELAWANQQLAGRRPPPDPASDRLGLVIAGRLAGRHGLGVRLGRSPAGGVTATVRLPASVLSWRERALPARA